MTGEVEKDGKVLIIKRIHVTYRLRLEAEKRDAAERAHGIHADFCPVARSIRGCIDISTSLEMDDL